MSTRQHTRISTPKQVMAFAFIATAFLLAACQPGPGTMRTQASPTTSETPAIPEALAKYHDRAVEQSTQFELDELPNVVAYNPCQDVNTEKLPEIGIKTEFVDLKPKVPGKIAFLCRFMTDEWDSKRIYVQHDYMNKSVHEENNEIIALVDDPRYPNAYFFTQSYDTKNVRECGVAIHTTRGRFAVFYNDTETEDPRTEYCPKALKYFEKFYSLPNVQEGLYGDS